MNDFHGANNLLTQLVQLDALSAQDAKNIAGKNLKVPVLTYLFGLGTVSYGAIAEILAKQFGFPYFDLKHFDLRHAPSQIINETLIQKHKVLPLSRRGKILSLAVADPTQAEAIEQIKFHTNMMIDVVVVEFDVLNKLIENYLNMGDSFGKNQQSEDDGLEMENLDLVDEAEDSKDMLENVSDDSPTVKFVNKVILDAIRKGASDLHFEPYEDEVRVRFRMDGILKTIVKAPIKIYTRISSRLKVMAQLDIAEKRIPQDGRMKVQVSKTRQIDFRVSTCPTMFGEKVVLRILDGSVANMGIEYLGYDPEQKALYLHALSQPYGMILVTGPTGSGKTVSLYTGLGILNVDARNISTAEDPVEIRVKGINQVQVNPKKGMTFGVALRSFLRQDPDVIMVGEIRDLETAEIAVKAAQTGHLVLSTLHTNDAPQAISRLVNMGIAPYNITSSVSLVIAQRLARRLHSCKKETSLSKTALIEAGFSAEEIEAGLKVYEPNGCSECNDGYKGRVGVYQVMPMTDNIQHIIIEHGNALKIAEAARADGVKDLRASGLEKVRQGLTSLAEIERIIVT